MSAMLVLVMVTMTPFQSVAGQINRFQVGDEVKGNETALAGDRATDGDRQVETPSETGPEDDRGLEPSTPSDAVPGEDTELEPATPSNMNGLKTNKTYVVKFYVGSELWDTQDVAYGGCAKEPTPPKKDGYTFIGWNLDYTNVVGNRSTWAQFREGTYETHKVTFTDVDGRWITNAQYVVHGQDAKGPTHPKRDGYTFVGWDKQWFCIKKDTVLQAQYREGILEVYSLLFKGRCPDKSGYVNVLKEEWIVKGEDGSPPDPEPVPGYTFKAWPDPERYFNVQKNETIYATYYTGDFKTYKVEFVDYDGKVLYAPQQIASGQDANRPPLPERDGYTFVGWDKQRFCIKQDTVITAQYREGAWDTFSLVYRGRCPDKSGYVNNLKEEWIVKGEDGSPPDPEPVPGYTFNAWPNQEKYANVQRSDIVHASYYTGDVKTYKIEFVDYDGESLSYPQYIAAGKSPSFPTPPKREGYTWTGWDKTLPPKTSSVELQAVYIPGTYETRKIIFQGRDVGTQSWIVLKEEMVPIGSDATPPIPPVNEGYVFTRWTGGYKNVQSSLNVLGYYSPEASVTGENKLKTFKSMISELDLPKELEDAVIELGISLAKEEDGEATTRIAGSLSLVSVIVNLALAFVGGYAAGKVIENIADSLKTSFGASANVAAELMWKVLNSEVEGDGETDAIVLGLSGIAASYGVFKCKEAADAMADYLKKQKKEFKFITMKYPSKPGTIISLSREAFLGDYNKAIISENGFHYGIEYNGIVFCNIHPLGLPRSAWEADFWGPGQELREITPP